jgi:hypothetical protein
MKKWIFIIFLIAVGFFVYKYVYHDHRDIETEKPEFSLTTIELSNEFSIAPAKSEKKYLNKTIEVTGQITGQSSSTVTLDNIVFCQFTNPIKSPLENNTQIKVKGRFIGYDDLFEEIKLDQCIIN